MNVVMTILGSLILINCTVNVDSMILNFIGNNRDKEIIIQEPKATEIYLIERKNVQKNVEEKKKEKEKADKKCDKLKKPGLLDFTPPKLVLKAARIVHCMNKSRKIGNEIATLEKQLYEDVLCTVPNICEKAFENSFFKDKNWGYDKKSTCSLKSLVTEETNSNTKKIQFVQCKVKSTKKGENISYIYLAASTKYELDTKASSTKQNPENKLIFFVLTEDKDGNVKPVAFLTNAKKPTPVKNETKEANLQLIKNEQAITTKKK